MVINPILNASWDGFEQSKVDLEFGIRFANEDFGYTVKLTFATRN